jgi:ElaB/YqjD/DUF883 family membrane-anchored ribosome-binding protein
MLSIPPRIQQGIAAVIAPRFFGLLQYRGMEHGASSRLAAFQLLNNIVKERLMDTTSSTPGGNGSDKASIAAQHVKGTFNEMKGAAQKSAATLRSELSSLKNDLDALVNRASGLSDDELSQAHAQLMAKFSSVRYAAKGIASEASRQFNRGMETTTGYVKDKPMQSVAVAAGAGLLLGMLFGRR